MIKVGDTIPNVTLKKTYGDKIEDINTSDFFSGKTTVVVALPGAFTPVCSSTHIPSFLQNVDQIKSKGVDQIACLSVNDGYVMRAWAKDQKAQDQIIMLADGNANFTKACGLEFDASAHGLGLRARRCVMIVKDKIVKVLDIEENNGKCELSHADAVLKKLPLD